MRDIFMRLNMGIAKKIALAVLLMIPSACATPMPPEKIASADYGPPPPAHYQQLVKDKFAMVLIDPTTPLYNFPSPPKKGYVKESRRFGTEEAFGWVVCGTVNSKNRMGGYTGASPFFVLFKNGQIHTFITSGSYNSVNSGHIIAACNR